MANIDVGDYDIANEGASNSGYTYITPANPANASGTIDTIKFKLAAEVSDKSIIIAIFEKVNGSTFTARDQETVTGISGSANDIITLTAPTDFTALNIVTGDYIGFYHSEGAPPARKSPNGEQYGIWYSASEETECTDKEFSFLATYDVSMYGETVEEAVTFIPQVIMIT